MYTCVYLKHQVNRVLEWRAWVQGCTNGINLVEIEIVSSFSSRFHLHLLIFCIKTMYLALFDFFQ